MALSDSIEKSKKAIYFDIVSVHVDIMADSVARCAAHGEGGRSLLPSGAFLRLPFHLGLKSCTTTVDSAPSVTILSPSSSTQTLESHTL